MQTQKIVLAVFIMPLLGMLAGCQPGGATQQSGSVVPAAPTGQLAAGNSATLTASGSDAMKLAKDTGCLACHSIDKKFLGPAWKYVAARYRDDPAAEAMLMSKIAKGGSGAWGSIEMPAYPGLDEANRSILVKFILSLK